MQRRVRAILGKVTATPRAVELAVAAARAASEKGATEVLALDVSEQLVITDVFVLAAAANDRQVRAVVDAIEDALHQLGSDVVRREGMSEARWVLLDFSDIVVHVQLAEDRQYYALERLWKDGPSIELPEDVTGPRSAYDSGTAGIAR
ncbi:ribosome-associated protein [Quadrisphaera granulorum]|uniref:Ribosomal silencing factor RsfS n=1 Tax=Quadrisphaera granulorum TaxID=317664 RepID=A0A316AV52_9ACTN|nr:ribosome-associated protein [Quadrisphaera granulorum]SZE96434.1 ribosome-associated protein [Quadrisphaera granulorum]